MQLILLIGKLSGLFFLANLIYRKRLNILCYHAFSLGTEHRFRPQQFIRPETFKRRMEYLKRKGYKVLPLSAAIKNMQTGRSSLKNIAITIDDGFYSVLKCAAPVLLKHAFPATLYVTTYYVKHSHPVFCLAVQYMFWITKRDHFDATGLLEDSSVKGLTPVNDTICWNIIEFGEKFLSEAGRIDLLEKLGTALRVPLEPLMRSRALSLLTPDEIRALPYYGIDVQLHTHRHQFPTDNNKLAKEIIENREFLSQCCNEPLVDFCYPSGEWRKEQWPVLIACQIRSATTCEIGLNEKSTSAYALRRFLDGENISDLEFEAELTGFKQLLRDARSIFLRASKPFSVEPASASGKR